MKLKVSSERTSPKVSVTLDETNVASICTSIEISHRAGELPEALLTLVPSAIEIESDVDMFVQIGEKRYRLVEQ